MERGHQLLQRLGLTQGCGQLNNGLFFHHLWYSIVGTLLCCCLHDVFLVLVASALLLLLLLLLLLYLSCQGEVTELQTLAAVQHHLQEGGVAVCQGAWQGV